MRCLNLVTSARLITLFAGLGVLLIELDKLAVVEGCITSGMLTLVAMAAILLVHRRQASRFRLDDGLQRCVLLADLWQRLLITAV